jgi:hypothetical protein
MSISPIVNEWTSPTLPILFYQQDLKTYEAIEKLIVRLVKKKNVIFLPDLLSFTKKYNKDIVLQYTTKDNIRSGLDALYEGITNLAEYIEKDYNSSTSLIKPIFKDGDDDDYLFGLKHINGIELIKRKIYESR